MIADGVLPENYNYNDVPLLTGENPIAWLDLAETAFSHFSISYLRILTVKLARLILPHQATSSTRPT